MIRKIILSITILFLFLPISAQEKLSIEEAIQIAVKNNYDILIAHNDADIARINNTPGNAGMLPSLQLGGSGNYSVADVKRDLASGTSNSYSSSTSTSLNGGAQLSWTLFDGGRMFVTKKKLSEIESLGSIQFRDQVLATVYDVIAAYYDVVRQKQELNSINELINYNRERVTIAQAGYQAGSMIRTDVLQAKIDLNVTMENAINQQFVIEAARKTLMHCLAGRLISLYRSATQYH